MSVFKDILNALNKFLHWIASEEAQETISKLANVALLVVGIIDKFNDPLSPDRKRETAWHVMKFFSVADEEVLEELMRAKKEGVLHDVKPHHVDLAMGLALSGYIHQKRERQGKAV